MKQQAITTSASTPKQLMVPRQLFEEAHQYVTQLEQAADEAFETLLKLYLTDETFAVLKRLQYDLAETLEIPDEDFSLRGALNELSCPCSDGLKQLQRTAKAIQKERKAA